MSLDLAVDQLVDTGWPTLDTDEHERDASGRLYPTPVRVAREFAAAGMALAIKRVDLFDCYSAEWTDAASGAPHAVVGATRDEAAVYALVRLRRTPTPAA